MMITAIEQKTAEIYGKLMASPQLSRFVDSSLKIPKIFSTSEEIRLIILGQDPTVKNQRSRAKINTVLNLDRKGSLRNYLNGICKDLEIDLDQNVYATNYLKNFFIRPPTQIKEDDVFEKFAQVWLPLLREELAQFDNAPIISLGEPVLSIIVHENASKLLRDYWGYNDDWMTGKTLPFRYIKSDDNVLSRVIFPFPHQPSINKKFYCARLKEYVAFVKQTIAN
ncbi:hypothetical protein L0244_23095 [bacterium]|nr:hypothetical protein [bacterium]